MMPYAILLSPDAAATRDALPAFLQRKVNVELLRLAGSPVQLSKPSIFPPYPLGYQVYEFETEYHEELHRFAILFKYMPSEEELWIHAIGRNYGKRSDV